ncbi:MAG: hypothetical protein U9O98_03560, partial [Asgard group archaeon]|nr:hypothetical protein [Asgard group archaeon]
WFRVFKIIIQQMLMRYNVIINGIILIEFFMGFNGLPTLFIERYWDYQTTYIIVLSYTFINLSIKTVLQILDFQTLEYNKTVLEK